MENLRDIIRTSPSLVDVRTPEEFEEGHVKNSINIPLQELPDRIDEFKTMKQPIVVFCRSGNRSGQAKSILQLHGIETHNGGAWQAVAEHLA